MALTTSTYLQIVNNVVDESGADLASFASNGSDFSTNTNTLLLRLKKYVSRAWKDIQMTAYDWDFMAEIGLCNLDPGVMVYSNGCPFLALQYITSPTNVFDQDGTVAIPNLSIGTQFDLTGLGTLTLPFGYFNVAGVNGTSPLNIALKPGAEYITNHNAGNTTLGTVGGVTSLGGGSYRLSVSANITFYIGEVIFAYDGTNLIIGTVTAIPIPGISVTVSLITSSGDPTQIAPGSPVGPIVFYIHGWKSFDFDEETQAGDFEEDIQEIDQDSFRVIDFYKGAPTGEIPMPFVPWDVFKKTYDLSSAYPGFPRIITRDDTGRWRMYPHPYYKVSVKFDYVRQPQILTNYNDTPRGLQEEFVDAIMWKALSYYGEFDEQPSVAMRAEKNLKNYMFRLELRNRKKFHFKPARLY